MEPHSLSVGQKLLQPLWNSVLHLLKKLEIDLSHAPALPLAAYSQSNLYPTTGLSAHLGSLLICLQ